MTESHPTRKKKTNLRLGFQGWFLTQPHTGIGRHCKGLIEALLRQKMQLTVLLPKALPAAELQSMGLKKTQVHVIKPLAFLPHLGLKKWFWEKVQVPAFFFHLNVDWEYYPYPCPLPNVSPHRRAMTVHDLILWKDPRYQGNALKKKYHREARRTLIHMDQLFSVSKATQHELGIPAALLLPNAVKIPSPAARPSKTQKKHKDLVYLGGYELRKRVPLLVERFLEYHKKHPESRLILVGEPHQKSKLYPALPKHSALISLGPKSDAEAFQLLQNAFAFVHASDSEGFNLPLLEAMLAGTPAVVTDLPVNREVSKETALFWNPSKKNALDAILKPLENSAQRQAQIHRQKKAAQTYSWDRTAHLLIQALSSHENSKNTALSGTKKQ
ncbi:glycosyltransferase [Candidatus Peregrinibacteria bacterium]|nr:MAG: glycosyltransferase [Candidatus Peregrinibacteria bacterium]